MPKKPRERYYQARGRPHAGLDDPAKFGLTFEEVVKLIDEGRWKGFYRMWRYHQKKKKICSVCKEKKKIAEGVSHLKICEDCLALVEEAERQQEELQAQDK